MSWLDLRFDTYGIATQIFIIIIINIADEAVGNMKRIQCSDWLPERARWAHLANIQPSWPYLVNIYQTKP